jgi:hypothetical protein
MHFDGQIESLQWQKTQLFPRRADGRVREISAGAEESHNSG